MLRLCCLRFWCYCFLMFLFLMFMFLVFLMFLMLTFLMFVFWCWIFWCSCFRCLPFWCWSFQLDLSDVHRTIWLYNMFTFLMFLMLDGWCWVLRCLDVRHLILHTSKITPNPLSLTPSWSPWGLLGGLNIPPPRLHVGPKRGMSSGGRALSVPESAIALSFSC